MIEIGILLTHHHRLLSVAAIVDVFESVNNFYRENGQQPYFNITLVSNSNSFSNGFSPYHIISPQNNKQFNVVFVPAFVTNDVQTAIKDNEYFLGWLHNQYSNKAEIASVCTGAFLLAASGLLDNKIATTHIDATGAFSIAFPLVKLKENVIVTQDQGIYTSGGSTNSFHLLIWFIEKYCGREMAVRIAKYFAIDMDREQQTYFATFRPSITTHDELVSTIQKRIRENFAEVTTVEELLQDIPASRRNLSRRFKLITGTTPIEYLQKTRIEAAKKVLEQPAGGVLESMIASGYNDEKTFRKLFKKTVGMTPSSYRQKYNNQRRVSVV